MNKVHVIDLFSGCGGSAMGFQQAGFDISVAVDINKIASDSFKLNFPGCAVINDDVTNISGTQLLRAGNLKDNNDVVIIACPPCQGFSSARRNSQRQGDQRNMLITQFLRLVEEIKPMGFVMENVPGLAGKIGNSVYSDVIYKLKNLGYQISENKVMTADFGVPQKRKRLVVIGVKNPRKDLKQLNKTHSKPTDKADLPRWITVRDVISDLPPVTAGEIHHDDMLHRASSLSELNLRRIKNTPHDGGGRSSWPDELILECHRNKNGHTDVYGRMKWDEPSPTMTGGCSMLSKGRYGHPEQDRAISLREAARLQTFPDDFKFSGNVGQIADQIGNAVPPLLARRAAEYLVEVLSR